MSGPVPADVYAAAVRIWIRSRTATEHDEAIVRWWAVHRWPECVPLSPSVRVFWVLSIAAQDGREAPPGLTGPSGG